MENKIDFVVTWIDPSDKKWINEKNFYEKNQENIDSRENRYRNWDTFKYWFRGVEKFAPWVNKIFFVTYGHVPNWLNINNPKLVIVNHKDFIPSQYLPTFNSNPIELNFNRIKSLSENFVYFNDDMFLINATKKEDFFINGKPCDSAILSPIIPYSKDNFAKVLAANIGIINTYFDKSTCIKKNRKKWFNIKYKNQLFRTLCLMPWNHFCGFYDLHIPTSYKKSTFNTIWEKEYKIIDKTCNSRFRDNNNNINHWLVRYWQICEGKFIPRSINFGKKFQYSVNNDVIYDTIIKQKYKTICLNDSEDNYNFEIEKEKTKVAFEKILQKKSSFEI